MLAYTVLEGRGGCPFLRLTTPRTASARSLSGVPGRSAVRNPSAVASATDSGSQRHQPLDLLIVNEGNAVNLDKRPVRLVGIEKVSASGSMALLSVRFSVLPLLR